MDMAMLIAGRFVTSDALIDVINPVAMAGLKGAGLGVEQSVEDLAEYTQIQVVNVARSA